jgi:hypothetical protein
VFFEPVNGKFYQRIGDFGDGLYIYYKYKVVPPSSPSAYGGESNTTSTTNWSGLGYQSMYYDLNLPTEFKLIRLKEFILLVNKQPYKVNKALVNKLFPDRAAVVKTYQKKHKLDMKDPDDVRTFVGLCYGTVKVD